MGLKVGDVIYYARVLHKCAIYDVYELNVVTVKDNYFTGCDSKRTKQTFIFNTNDLGSIVFTDRDECLSLVKEQEKYKIKLTTENE